MSRANIVAIETLAPEAIEWLGPVGLVGLLVVKVTFRTKTGEERSYIYFGTSALEILKGGDPARYSGTRIG